jgi:hypothetical protein
MKEKKMKKKEEKKSQTCMGWGRKGQEAKLYQRPRKLFPCDTPAAFIQHTTASQHSCGEAAECKVPFWFLFLEVIILPHLDQILLPCLSLFSVA